MTVLKTLIMNYPFVTDNTLLPEAHIALIVPVYKLIALISK